MILRPPRRFTIARTSPLQLRQSLVELGLGVHDDRRTRRPGSWRGFPGDEKKADAVFARCTVTSSPRSKTRRVRLAGRFAVRKGDAIEISVRTSRGSRRGEGAGALEDVGEGVAGGATGRVFFVTGRHQMSR